MVWFTSDNLTYGIGFTNPGHLDVAFCSTYDEIKTSHDIIIENTDVGNYQSNYYELTEATSSNNTCEALPTGIYSEVGAPRKPEMEVSSESAVTCSTLSWL